MVGTGKTGAPPDPAELAERPDVHVIPTAPEETRLLVSRRARKLRRIFMTLVAVFLLLGATGFLGVRTTQVGARGGGYELTVTYGQVSRPGLATPFGIEIRHPGGFDGPVTVSSRSSYLSMFDENGLDPDPSSVTATAEQVIWQFDPPPGEVLSVSLDARVEPGVQWGRSGETSVLEDGHPVVTARYHTWIMP
jgi:hypothetical protein